jgi:DNA-directed RNA polymerase subunit beta'
MLRIANTRIETKEYALPPDARVLVGDQEEVAVRQVLAESGAGEIISEISGVALVEANLIRVHGEVVESSEYELPVAARLRVAHGDKVTAGDQLTEGAKNPREILRILGVEATERYLVDEIQRVYHSQGVNIHDKHIEVVTRQLLRRVRIRSSGDTDYLPGEIVDRFALEEMNARALEQGRQPATAAPILLGVTRAALATDSFLAAASFQETTRVLTDAAIRGRVDELRGLKENVILGKLIPVGTGFRPYVAPVRAEPEWIGENIAEEFTDADEIEAEAEKEEAAEAA